MVMVLSFVAPLFWVKEAVVIPELNWTRNNLPMQYGVDRMKLNWTRDIL